MSVFMDIRQPNPPLVEWEGHKRMMHYRRKNLSLNCSVLFLVFYPYFDINDQVSSIRHLHPVVGPVRLVDSSHIFRSKMFAKKVKKILYVIYGP